MAGNDIAVKNGSSKPKVTLSFELSRSGLIALNKAEAKIEELVWIEEKVKKSSSLKNKTKSTINNGTDNSTNSTNATSDS